MAAPQLSRDPRHKEEIPTLDQVFIDFGGVNVQSPRQSIRDDQFAWIENFKAIASGNLTALPAAQATPSSFSAQIDYAMTANIGGVDYLFAFASDGSAYYTPDGSYTNTSFAPVGTFHGARAIPYTASTGAQGILVIDPVTGYYDFSVTTAFTLTQLSNRVQEIKVTNPGTYTVVPSSVTFTGGGGTGATAEARLGVRSATVSAAGAGYVVGDVLTIPFVLTAPTPTTFTVTAVNGSGGVTGFTITTAGQGYNPNTNPVAATGGAGSGATFTCTYGLTAVVITNQGQNYTSAPSIGLSGGVGSGGTASSTVTGGMTGTALASYAGRIWVANGRTISYTDVASYNSFGGAGGQLSITDSYLHDNITALYAANGYLYIFGDSSIDTLSNVQVSATTGVTSFSRTNITASVGSSYQQSIFPYFRSLMFANKYGIFALSGATPQKISDDLDGLFQTAVFVDGLVAGSVNLFGSLCMVWTLRFIDTFTTLYGVNVTRTILVIFDKGKWSFASPGFEINQIVSIPSSGSQVLHAYTRGLNAQLYQLFYAGGTAQIGYIQSKLWAGGSVLTDKEVLRMGVNALFVTQVNQRELVTTDNEYGTQPVVTINNGQQDGQVARIGTATTSGGKYYGFSCTTYQTDIVFLQFALEYRATRPW